MALYCGDLTTESSPNEYNTSIRFLQAVKAPLRLATARNHDFNLESREKVAEVQPALDPGLVEKTYDHYGKAGQ